MCPQQAERAIRHYFSQGNLTALRELALRRTAQRVDEQLLSHMRAHAIPGPWAAGERILVCVSEAPSTAGLIRYARRVADRLQVPWTAIYVETARTQRLTDAERDRIADFLRLAERLGASTITIPGRNIAEEVVAYATANNITQIVIGKSNRSRWFEMVHGSVVHELVRKTGPISVHVISSEDSESVPPKSVETHPGRRANPDRALSRQRRRSRRRPRYRPAAQTVHRSSEHLAGVPDRGACLGNRLGPLAFAVRRRLEHAGLQFLLSCRRFTRLRSAIPRTFLRLFFFLIVAIIVSNLTARTRSQMVTRAITGQDNG